MTSTRTQPIAARVPNDVAEQVRQKAERHGVTVSDVVGACVSGLLSDREQSAIRTDAQERLAELRAVRVLLWDDRDDPEVLSELVSVQSQIRLAEQELAR
jgi:hypothetical protein